MDCEERGKGFKVPSAMEAFAIQIAKHASDVMSVECTYKYQLCISAFQSQLLPWQAKHRGAGVGMRTGPVKVHIMWV